MPNRKTEDIVEFHGIYTASPKMHRLFTVIEKVAKTDFSVLVRGETGSGKELVARAIHKLSDRKQAPYQVINCAALSPELIISELFGHNKGAFTGAINSHQGLFEVANRGSVFLDEVGELPLQIQARLLRVIEQHTFYRLGSTKSQSVNIRFISATNRSLRQMVSQGSFREDLMYRLRVIPIFLPPLRERPEDIKVLADRFINEVNQLGARSIKRIHKEAYEAMRAYAWPGNIRELRNNIEHAYAIGGGDTLTLNELTPELRGEMPFDTHTNPHSMTAQEKYRIIQSIHKHGGRRDQMAKDLGMSRTTLWRKIREHGLAD